MSRVAPLVLLVEDSPDDIRVALRALGRMEPHVELELARDGGEAMEALGLAGTPARRLPALVVCDLKMPMVRGDELLKRVRADASLAKLPFVVFTSSDEPEDEARCAKYGADEYAVKPVAFDAYEKTIRALVTRHLPPVAF